MNNPFSLEGKHILVTGAASGIGRSVAVEASKMGATIILVDLNEERMKETMALMSPGEHQMYAVNLTDMEALESVAGMSCELDGLVNCAGIGLTLPFKFCGEQELKRVMSINFYAPVLLTQMLVKKKKIRKNASIVYMTSIDGTVTGHIGNSIYSASKGAILGSARSQALELAPRGIRVNCVSPARVNTPLLKRDNISEEQVQANMQLYPMKRYAEPEEIAYYIIYLLSDASTYTTGSNLVIDGGFTIS
ncbi:MAG: SDR family oxidoreductase [Bacteroidaceae bacterium]|jgi:NAD(P)-dependent dehydrogenase (short-subunit alcohol dehydrogenase family)|nr:SDR family oxidoreductase [Bacteroidaceae bacterium]